MEKYFVNRHGTVTKSKGDFTQYNFVRASVAQRKSCGLHAEG